MKKAIIITNDPKAYRAFIRSTNVNSNEYSWVKNTRQLKGYHNIIAICLYGWIECVDREFEDYANTHNIDFLYYDL